MNQPAKTEIPIDLAQPEWQYKCIECGYEFDEPILIRESRGEFWGEPCYETFEGCPHCRGEFLSMDDFYDIEEEEDEDDETD